MTTKNKNEEVCECGHKRPEIIILDCNELSYVAYLEYWEQRGKLCWDCFCNVPKNQSNSQQTKRLSNAGLLPPVSDNKTADRKTELSESGSRIENGSVPNQEAILKEFDKRADNKNEGMQVFSREEVLKIISLTREAERKSFYEGIQSDRFFSKCKKCGEVIEETDAYQRGMIKERKSKEEDIINLNKQLLISIDRYKDLQDQLSSQKEKILEMGK